MSNVNKLKELLDGNFFKYKGKEYFFKSCKLVSYRMMILTDSETLQIDEVSIDLFIEEISPTVSEYGTQARSFVPNKLATNNTEIVIPENAKIFQRLNDNFEALLTSYENAKDGDLELIIEKSKVLNSVAKSAIDMQNSNIQMYKLFNK